MPPDKGKGKAVPDDTAWGGSGQDPPRDEERAYCLKRQNESDDHLQSCSVHHHPTMRSDNEEILDRFLCKMDELDRYLDEAAAEAKRRADEVHANTWNSLAELHQSIHAWKDRQWSQEQCGHSEWGDNCHPPPLLKEGGEPVVQKRLVVQQASQMC